MSLNKQSGLVLVFCLATLMVLSLYALAAMEKSRLLHKQVAAFSHSKQLEYLTELTLAQAVDVLKQDDNDIWPKDVMAVTESSGWRSIKLPTPYMDIAQADFYVQNLGVLKQPKNNPKVISIDNTVPVPESHLYRITSKVHLYKIYSRIFEMDYVKVIYD